MRYSHVVKFFGNATKAGEALGLTRQAVSYWKTRGIKKDRQRFIEMVTHGKLKADK